MTGKRGSLSVVSLHLLVCLSMLFALVGSALLPASVDAAAPESSPVENSGRPAETLQRATGGSTVPFLRVVDEGWDAPAAQEPEQQTVPIGPIMSFHADSANPAVSPSGEDGAEVEIIDVDESAPVPPEPEPVLPHRPPVWLTVRAEPEIAEPGDIVTLIISVQADEAVDAAELSSVLPEGLMVEPGDAARYDPGKQAAVLTVGAVDKGTRDIRVQLRMGEDTKDLTVQQVQLWAPGYAGPAVGEVVIKRSFPTTEAEITPDKGGELTSADGRVHVVFPPGAVEQTLRVQHVPRRVDRAADRTDGMAIEFELNAFTADDAATAVHRFARPLEVRVDMSGLLDFSSLKPWQYAYLAYYDEGKREWVSLESAIDGRALVASLDHFTTVGAASGNNVTTGWLLAFNEARVSTFDGGLSYVYPVQVPEGRGGLTPDLSLTYSSRRIDGIATWIQSDYVGLGWDLDTMSIVRNYRGAPDYYFENKFTLMYKGTGYKLVPATSGAYGRYYIEDEQFYYIERRNDPGGNGSASNTTSEYWIVRLRDGTEYRLGYNGDSEQVVSAGYSVPLTPTESTYAGKTSGKVAFRWRADSVTDTTGNAMACSYVEETQDGHDHASYLDTVSYNKQSDGNWGTRVTLGRSLRSSDSVGDTGFSAYTFYQNSFLSAITVENRVSGSFSLVRLYKLAYTGDNTDSKPRRMLTSITEYGTGGTGEASLPTTVFSYTLLMNKNCNTCVNDGTWANSTFAYPRMTLIDNGYRGVITATYTHPSDEDGWGNGQEYNYRVSEKSVYDSGGLTGGYEVSYAYSDALGDRCYRDPTTATVYGCYFFSSDPGGPFMGYHYVTETLETLSDAGVSSTVHHSQLDTEAVPNHSKGRELVTSYRNDSGADMQVISTTWTVDVITPTGTVTTYFSHPSWTYEATRENNAIPAVPQKKTWYSYSTSSQGNAQYGNLTQQLEYSGTTAVRSTLSYFYPYTGTGDLVRTGWIVGLPGLTWVKDGAGNTVAKTKHIYDNVSNSYDTPPVRGKFVRQDRLNDVGASTWITAQIITYTQSYSLPYQVQDALGNVTTTQYDATWSLYPLTVTNALNQSTVAAYDYVLGKPTSVTGPNGASTTVSYEYDSFSRLISVIQPGDNSTYPTVLIQYNDTATPFRIHTFERVTSNTSTSIPNVKIYNGLGQLVEEHQGTTAHAGGEMAITNYSYNAQGKVVESYLPYTMTFYWGYQGPVSENPKTITAYDALGRTEAITHTDGTTITMKYDGLKVGVVDENHHQKVQQVDPFGRLEVVKEYTSTYGAVDWNGTLYATTQYAYTVTDQLTVVTDTLSNVTRIYYDPLGRKTSMQDPDMGTWSYTYDNQGNLTRQTDANGNRTCLFYDQLNRLTGKRYQAGDSCTTSPTPTVQYGYDSTTDSNMGIGYRTAMTDTTGNATWKYDEHGRVTREVKVVAQETYTTQWTYNARDQVLTQAYPGVTPETVTTAYDTWGRPTTLTGSGSYGYVVGTEYTALGQIDLLKRGGSAGTPTLRTDYTYYDETGRMRLQSVRTGHNSPDYEELQKLEYTYDNLGNVLTIADYNAGGTQTQTFTYDVLNRLATAEASGGSDGTYAAEAYVYNEIGNLMHKDDADYTYPASGSESVRPHAVTAWNGNTYTYDSNGNMTGRNLVGDVNYTLAYTVDNRVTSVTGNGNTELYEYDGDGNRVRATRNGVQTLYVGGNLEVEQQYRETFASGAPGWTAASGTWAVSSGTYRQSNSVASNTNAYRSQTQSGPLVYRWKVTYTTGTQASVYIYASAGTGTERGSSYRISQDSTTVKVYECNNDTSVQRASWSASNSAGQTHTYVAAYDPATGRIDVWRDGVNLGYWTDATPLTSGAYLSLRTDSTDASFDDVIVEKQIQYYLFAGKRVAMRDYLTVYWLLGDHLGSTSVTANADGTKKAELRYKAYGENRYTDQTTPTSYRYTGQREEAGIGLYYYVARWYDPVLGRFVQADTIVPGPGDPQALNRYSYVRNNPLRFVDPSGFDPLDAEWERAFHEAHGRAPGLQDKRDRLFSVIFSGSGPNGAWTDEDWSLYASNKEELWLGKAAWPGDVAPSLDRWIGRVRRLRAAYNPWEEDQFVQAFGLVWGGIPLLHKLDASIAMLNVEKAWATYGTRPLQEGNAGWDPELCDADGNAAHHYAGLFYAGYFWGEFSGGLANWLRDRVTRYVRPDYILGIIALRDGNKLRCGQLTINQVPDQIMANVHETWIRAAE